MSTLQKISSSFTCSRISPHFSTPNRIRLPPSISSLSPFSLSPRSLPLSSLSPSTSLPKKHMYNYTTAEHPPISPLPSQSSTPPRAPSPPLSPTSSAPSPSTSQTLDPSTSNIPTTTSSWSAHPDPPSSTALPAGRTAAPDWSP